MAQLVCGACYCRGNVFIQRSGPRSSDFGEKRGATLPFCDLVLVVKVEDARAVFVGQRKDFIALG